MTDTRDTLAEQAFKTLADTSEEADLPEAARAAEPENFLRHAVSLSLTKTADGLIDPKLVLSWLLSNLGAGSFWVGLLVPVRESLALLPQPLIAAQMAGKERRKWLWAGGSAVQGLAALCIAVAALTLSGWAAGLAVVAALAALATARAFCSTSYKDVLGKTVAKTRRGTATGVAGSVSAVAVIAFALILIGVGDARMTLVIAALLLATALWFAASTIFATLKEPASETTEDSLADRLRDQWATVKDDPQFRRFIVTRAALVGTALSPPFLVVLAGGGAERIFSQLGALVLASSAAAFVSSYVWGRLSDRSSRTVLMLAGHTGGTALALGLGAAALGVLGSVWVAPAILFLLMLAHNGVRSGRSTHLVDMAPEDQRPAYTAVSNLAIGVWLVVFGAATAGLASLGAGWALALCMVSCLVGAGLAARLDEVQ